MEDETNRISKILYTILIILICVILEIYMAKWVYSGNWNDTEEESVKLFM